jgi:ATP-binding protein involved in chromosome partitioning
MFERVHTPFLGLVENMAGLACPHCGGHVDVFGHGGGEKLASDMGVRLLGRIPLDPEVRIAGDEGRPTTVSAPGSEAGKAFRQVAERVLDAIAAPRS